MLDLEERLRDCLKVMEFKLNDLLEWKATQTASTKILETRLQALEAEMDRKNKRINSLTSKISYLECKVVETNQQVKYLGSMEHLGILPGKDPLKKPQTIPKPVTPKKMKESETFKDLKSALKEALNPTPPTPALVLKDFSEHEEISPLKMDSESEDENIIPNSILNSITVQENGNKKDCSFCDHVCDNDNELEKHIDDQHLGDSKPDVDLSFSDDMLKKMTMLINGSKRLSDEDDSPIAKKQAIENGDIETGEKFVVNYKYIQKISDTEFMCTYEQCHRIHKSRSSARKHYRTVHLKLFPHMCKECDRGFPTFARMQKHMELAHPGAAHSLSLNL